MSSAEQLKLFTLIVIVQSTLTNFAFSDNVSTPRAWALQAERDASKLVKPGKIKRPRHPGKGVISGDDFLRRVRDQVHDTAQHSLHESGRLRRRDRLRQNIREDIRRSPRNVDHELAIQPRPGSNASRLEDSGNLSETYSDPSITKMRSPRAVTRLLLDGTRSPASGASLPPSSSDTATSGRISADDRPARPIHGRPGIRPLPEDSNLTNTDTLPIDHDSTTVPDTRVNGTTHPSPTTGGSTRAPDRRSTRDR